MAKYIVDFLEIEGDYHIYRSHAYENMASPEQVEEDGGRAGINDVVKSAISDGRVLGFDKKRREDLSVIAKSAGLGNITEASLEKSVAQFRQFINGFREKNRISYFDRDSNGNLLTKEQMVI